MRNDKAPFTDPRVRQAIALTLNRPQIVQALFKGYADVGNDSPFAPVFPSTNTSVAQRTQDISQGQVAARRGRARLGLQHPARHRELRRDPPVRPDHRAVGQGDRGEHQPEGGELEPVLRQGHVRELRLAGRHHEPGRLRAPQRAERVPDLAARDVPTPRRGPARGTPPTSANAQYDKLVAQYIAASDLSTQKTLAGQIETLLLAQTPIIFGYFYNYLTATTQGRDRGLPDRDRAPVPVQRREELGPPELAHSGAFGVR